MVNAHEEFIPTRQSLLSRLKDWNDQESWKSFFDTYWKLIYNTALRAGLNEAEAQDVVQETVISVLKSMPTFQYDMCGSFKQWLLRLTGWRITDQLRKRQEGVLEEHHDSATSTGTATLDRLPDPVRLDLEKNWDADWERNLLDAALERVKARVDSKQYQMFDLCVFKGWPAPKVAQTLKVSMTLVYVTKYRINKLVKQEVDRLKKTPLP